jgi:hypothetical protein
LAKPALRKAERLGVESEDAPRRPGRKELEYRTLEGDRKRRKL